jgi:ribonucleoside-triphosphate reductase
VYSRIVGYFRPVQNWNIGKQEEFKDRLEFTENKTLTHATKMPKLETAVACKTC